MTAAWQSIITITDGSFTSAWAGLYLQAWLSPAFPVGGFAYSHGIETAVDAGDVVDASSLERWLDDLIQCGSIRNDAILVAESWTAVRERDADRVCGANDLALALSPSRERALETSAIGTAFAATIRSAWPGATTHLLPPREVAYPVAFGAAAGAVNVPLAAAVVAYGLAFVQNLVSAAVRLGPIGQTDGQRITARLLPAVDHLGAMASTWSLDDLGGCAQRSDIAAMRHETLYSRLFRS